MSVTSGAIRVGRNLVRAYRLACAREDLRRMRLRTPLGVWFCDQCRLVMFDGLVWRDHLPVCAG